MAKKDYNPPSDIKTNAKEIVENDLKNFPLKDIPEEVKKRVAVILRPYQNDTKGIDLKKRIEDEISVLENSGLTTSQLITQCAEYKIAMEISMKSIEDIKRILVLTSQLGEAVEKHNQAYIEKLLHELRQQKHSRK